MLISVVNHTNGRLSDEEVQDGVRAVNRQISHDFKPYWHISAELRLEGTVGKRTNSEALPELRGDAIIYLWDKVDVEDALGYHDLNGRGIPFGFVFTDVVKELGEAWTVTFSHEALELIGDPEANRLVTGPHPADRRVQVFHWYEMCDAVQDESYKVDGVDVSNFLLPLYFTRDAEAGGRNDFLGRHGDDGQPLASFGINKGGYIGFFNPKTRKHETVALDGDARAKKRLKAKSRANLTRRSMRYKTGLYFREQVAAAMPIPDDRRRPSDRRRTPPVAARAAAPAAQKRGRAIEVLDSTNERQP
jgi:hypothetical protein